MSVTWTLHSCYYYYTFVDQASANSFLVVFTSEHKNEVQIETRTDFNILVPIDSS